MRPNTRLLTTNIWRQGPVADYFICASCRTQQQALSAQRRRFSFTPSRAAPFPPPPAPPSAGLVELSSRRLIAVEGPDAARFLQGIVTQNILATAATASHDPTACYSAILNAAGRVLYDVFIYPDHHLTTKFGGNNFLVEVDASQAANLEKHLKRYKLRAKVTVTLLSRGALTVWHAWSDNDDHSPQQQQQQQAKLLTEDLLPPNSAKLLRDPRAPGLGYRILTSGEDPPPLGDVVASLLPRVSKREPGPLAREEDEAAYRVRRYLYGVPEGPDEVLQEKALPLEGNLDVMGGVDFRKGCYVGQELTIRTKHQGIVRKRILPVMLYDASNDSSPPETLAYQPDLVGGDGGIVDAANIPKDTSIGRVGRKGRSAGKWLRGVGNIGLALCRLETMTDVVLPGETAATAYNPADEFVMVADEAGGTKVKVKAFVPEWLRKGLDGQQQHG